MKDKIKKQIDRMVLICTADFNALVLSSRLVSDTDRYHVQIFYQRVVALEQNLARLQKSCEHYLLLPRKEAKDA